MSGVTGSGPGGSSSASAPGSGSGSGAGSSLTISPAEIVFTSNSGSGLMATLKLTNNQSKLLAFKVKTTSPKNYMVKPSSGVVEVGGSVEVTIALQAASAGPQVSTDRFLVISAVCDSAAGLDKQGWQELDDANKTETKIRVNYKGDTTAGAPAANSAAANTGVNGSAAKTGPAGSPGSSFMVQPVQIPTVSADASKTDILLKFEEAVRLLKSRDADCRKAAGELEAAKASLASRGSALARATRAAGAPMAGGYTLAQLILAIIVAVVVARVASTMGY